MEFHAPSLTNYDGCMKYVAGFLLAAGLATIIFLWTRDGGSPATSEEPPLELSVLGARITLVQRHDDEVPGSDGRLRVHIGDITRGQVALTLTNVDGRSLIPTTSVEEGDRLAFSFGGRRYGLAVLELRNELIGDDTAELEFYAGKPERERIESLLDAVENSSLTFLRNGREYHGEEAAKHLRRKWRIADGRIKTAEQFIANIATRSSTTGRPYQVRLPDGRVADLRPWLTQQVQADVH